MASLGVEVFRTRVCYMKAAYRISSCGVASDRDKGSNPFWPPNFEKFIPFNRELHWKSVSYGPITGIVNTGK